MGMKDNGSPEKFKNRAAALSWLQSRGQISRGKFYMDCAAGHLSIYPDKTLSKFQVAEYAEKVFGFARQSIPTKPVRKSFRRSIPPQAGLFDAGPGPSAGKTKGWRNTEESIQINKN